MVSSAAQNGKPPYFWAWRAASWHLDVAPMWGSCSIVGRASGKPSVVSDLPAATSITLQMNRAFNSSSKRRSLLTVEISLGEFSTKSIPLRCTLCIGWGRGLESFSSVCQPQIQFTKILVIISARYHSVKHIHTNTAVFREFGHWYLTVVSKRTRSDHDLQVVHRVYPVPWFTDK